MNVSINQIQDLVFKLGKNVEAPKSLLMIRTLPSSDGTPYLEINNDVFNYISSERGYEIYRKSTNSLDDLLYWILRGVASEMAMEYELNNRKKSLDSRRIYFSKLIFFIEKINPKWIDRVKQEIQNILKKSPYKDN